MQIFAIGIVLQSKVKRKVMQSVKSQSKYLAGQKFDQGRRLGYKMY